jgi:hypothetical protein
MIGTIGFINVISRQTSQSKTVNTEWITAPDSGQIQQIVEQILDHNAQGNHSLLPFLTIDRCRVILPNHNCPGKFADAAAMALSRSSK